MNIVLIGPQGSGKGTQARLIYEKFNFFYFESGAFLRKIAENNQELKEALASGMLVPDREMTSYLSAFLDQEGLYDDVIFDGFPRTVDQFKFWRKWLEDKEVKLDLTLLLVISEEETVRRLSARRLDPNSGAIYNLVTDPPPKDVDVNSLVHRDDDKPEAIKKRLALYKERTEPLVEELKTVSEVVEVGGERPIDEIAKEIKKIIEYRLRS